MLLGVDGVGEEPIEGGGLGVRHRSGEAVECLAADADVHPEHPGPSRQVRDPVPSKSSIQTIVTKFGKCFSASREKKTAPSIVTRSACAYVARIWLIDSLQVGPGRQRFRTHTPSLGTACQAP